LKHQNKRRSIKAALLTAALAGVCATGATAPSLAAGAHHGKALRHHRGGAKATTSGLQGVASVYHDRKTANGERMNANAMTAAHKSLPMGSIVTVHNKRNGRSVTVRINDRGPYVAGRVIDLSPGAARVIGMDGLAPVSLTVNGRHG
jgi:rare lipoprotein A